MTVKSESVGSGAAGEKRISKACLAKSFETASVPAMGPEGPNNCTLESLTLGAAIGRESETTMALPSAGTVTPRAGRTSRTKLKGIESSVSPAPVAT